MNADRAPTSRRPGVGRAPRLRGTLWRRYGAWSLWWPSDEQWGTPKVDRTLRLAKGRTGMVFGLRSMNKPALSHGNVGPPPDGPKKRKKYTPSFIKKFIKPAFSRGMANKAMPSTGIVRSSLLLWSGAVRTRRSSPNDAREVGRTRRTRRWERGLD